MTCCNTFSGESSTCHTEDAGCFYPGCITIKASGCASGIAPDPAVKGHRTHYAEPGSKQQG